EEEEQEEEEEKSGRGRSGRDVGAWERVVYAKGIRLAASEKQRALALAEQLRRDGRQHPVRRRLRVHLQQLIPRVLPIQSHNRYSLSLSVVSNIEKIDWKMARS